MLAALSHQFSLAAPLFLLVLIGYGLIRWGRWPKSVSDALTRFVFTLALPALLFRLMSDSSSMPPVDSRLLIAFFGGCFIVFAIGRFIATHLFGLDGVAASVFAQGGIFSNNVLLGLPLAKLLLGEASVPSVALVVVFNALVLWTLVTVSIEWAKNGTFSLTGFRRASLNIIANPIIIAIIAGTLLSLTGLPLPTLIDAPLSMIAQASAPLSLIVLGMGLAEYDIRQGWQQSSVICTLKLIVQPLAVWALARLLGLPAMETNTVVLLASCSVGVNVYIMARQFQVLQGPVATSLVFSTLLAALTTPLILTLLGAGMG